MASSSWAGVGVPAWPYSDAMGINAAAMTAAQRGNDGVLFMVHTVWKFAISEDGVSARPLVAAARGGDEGKCAMFQMRFGTLKFAALTSENRCTLARRKKVK